jgi:Arc/MetJ-type ribon-helix-helix transcriptional regulator
MPQSTIRFPDKTHRQIQEVVKQRGFTSAAALIRHAVQQECDGREDGAEQRIAGQIRGDLARLHRVQQTLFAFVDTLANSAPDWSNSEVPGNTIETIRAENRPDAFLQKAVYPADLAGVRPEGPCLEGSNLL